MYPLGTEETTMESNLSISQESLLLGDDVDLDSEKVLILILEP